MGRKLMGQSWGGGSSGRKLRKLMRLNLIQLAILMGLEQPSSLQNTSAPDPRRHEELLRITHLLSRVFLLNPDDSITFLDKISPYIKGLRDPVGGEESVEARSRRRALNLGFLEHQCVRDAEKQSELDRKLHGDRRDHDPCFITFAMLPAVTSIPLGDSGKMIVSGVQYTVPS